MRIDLTPPSWATHLLSDRTDWKRDPVPIERLEPFDLPDDVYFEYAWRDREGEMHPDPDNPGPRLNPWWEFASHLTGPNYLPDPDSLVGDARPQGRVLRLKVDSTLLNQTRVVLVYSPAGHAESELPLVLFQDGKAYYGWGKTAQVFDRLLRVGAVEPAHLVFVPPVSRTLEYAFNPTYRAFLLDELLPFVEERASCNGIRISWGASLGGLLAAQLAWMNPEIFQTVVTQSGAYLFSEDMDQKNPYAGNESFLGEVSAAPGKDIRWHLQCGSLEWLFGSNERIAAALSDSGHDVQWTVRNAGHNWVNWRNGLAEGLRFALGGPKR